LIDGRIFRGRKARGVKDETAAGGARFRARP